MSIAVFDIDPDGDVDLLLPHLEELAAPLDGVSTYVSRAPGLNYRRSNVQYPWTDEQYCDDAVACEKPESSEAVPASEEFQQYDEVPPPTESQLEPTSEAPRSDELSEPQQSREPETLAIQGEHCSTDQKRTVDEQDTTSTRDGKYVQIRVLLKHLTFASPHFKRNLRSGMLESQALRS